MDPAHMSALITAIALATFVVSGWAVFWIWRARHSGWNRLSAAYPDRPSQVGPAHRFTSIQFQPSHVRYRRCITFHCTVEGLHMAPTLLCRFGHHRLLIPWEEIEITNADLATKDRTYDLQFARVPQVRIRIGVHMAQHIRRAADTANYFDEPHPTPTPQPRRTVA